MTKAEADNWISYDGAMWFLIEFLNGHQFTFDSQSEHYANIRALAEHEHLHDVEFVVQEETIKAIKLLLIAQSRVFGAMFSNEWKERDNRIVVDDIEAGVMRELVSGIQTCTINFRDDAIFAIKLKIAAHKYEINFIEQLASHHIKHLLRADNVLEVLSLADLYDQQEIKQCALDFVVTKVNGEFTSIPGITSVPGHIRDLICNTMFRKLQDVLAKPAAFGTSPSGSPSPSPVGHVSNANLFPYA